MKNIKELIISILALSLSISSLGKDYEVKSPNGGLVIQIGTEGQLHWSVHLYDEPVLESCPVSMILGTGETLGISPVILQSDVNHVDKVITPEIPRRKATLEDRYNELTLNMKGGYSIVFRAYDYGLAYRFETNLKDSIEVLSEQLELRFSENMLSWFPEEESFISHNEREYRKENIQNIHDISFCSLPVLFQEEAGVNILFTESDLYNYPGAFLYGSGSKNMKVTFPRYVLDVSIPNEDGDRNEIISREANYIAKTEGTRMFPWRVFYVTEQLSDLFEHDLVFQLSRPCQISDTEWIKPGKVAWDWWNAKNVYGVDFKSGINTETYKYYIDFASKYGLEYIILDEGWSKSTTDVMHCNHEVDLKELIRYGSEKNVGIIIWLLWKPLDEDMNAILNLYRDWGVKGIKVDFMQRSDQYMVEFCERVAREAAKRELLVDLHGIFKPTGLYRAYPNLITREGVKGLENDKWSDFITPEHDVTLPFIRMVAGSMDYTPGSMENAQTLNFFPRLKRPMSQGTRCHQLAMYVVYESPLQMLADSPSNYYRESESTTFISRIPTTWEDTRVLEARVGEYIAIARKKGSKWYIGAMTNGQAREMELDFSFLGDGIYEAEIMQDGINADRFAQDYKKTSLSLSATSKLNIHLAPGGGWAAIVSTQE